MGAGLESTTTGLPPHLRRVGFCWSTSLELSCAAAVYMASTVTGAVDGVSRRLPKLGILVSGLNGVSSCCDHFRKSRDVGTNSTSAFVFDRGE